MDWSPRRRRRRRRPEVMWEKEVLSVMQYRNLTYDDALKRQLWRLKSSDRWITGKLIKREIILIIISLKVPQLGKVCCM